MFGLCCGCGRDGCVVRWKWGVRVVLLGFPLVTTDRPDRSNWKYYTIIMTSQTGQFMTSVHHFDGLVETGLLKSRFHLRPGQFGQPVLIKGIKHLYI